MKINIIYFLVLLILSVSFYGCATYYQKSLAFQQEYTTGDLNKANSILDSNKKAGKGKDRLLFFLQKGVVLQSLGKYEESNLFLEKAYSFLEEFKIGVGAEIESYVSNPGVKPYLGEDHERVLVHYYKALNYLLLEEIDAALVECRRLDNKLKSLNDKYEKRRNRYKIDALAHNLMGICYEIDGDLNNSYIAYKNALTAYEDLYSKEFNTNTPLQLKKDLLRLAFMNGFYEEQSAFEKKFGFKNAPLDSKNGEVVLFLHNGLGPVKDEWSINFFIVKGKGGVITFVNEELGLSFPFPLENMNKEVGIGDLKFIRVAFPKYLERKPYYRNFTATKSGIKYPLEKVEDINAIAFSTLEDRMIRELSKSLLRLAIKQSAENLVGNKNENLGALLSVYNAVSEKADTRNWQTLPYEIAYARIPLDDGSNNLILEMLSPQKSRSKKVNLQFEGKKNKTVFGLYNNLESIPIGDY